MKKKIFAYLVILSLIIYLVFFKPSKPSAFLSPLADSPDTLVVPTPTPTPSPIPSPTPVASPTPTLSPSPSPQTQYSSEQIQGFVGEFSSKYGLDPNQVRHIAVCESGFNPSATYLTYAGLFQFSPNTWIKYRNLLQLDSNPDLRLDAKAAIETATYVMSLNQTSIWPNCVPE